MRRGCRICAGKMDRIRVELLWHDIDGYYSCKRSPDEIVDPPRRIVTKCRECGHEADIMRGDY